MIVKQNIATVSTNYKFYGILLVIVLFLLVCNITKANKPTTISTFHSIGIYWSPLSGSSNTKVFVKFREKSESNWREGLPMKFNPIDGTDEDISDYRGSIVNLKSGTTYEVELALENSDETTNIIASTWDENSPIGKIIFIESSNSTLPISESGTEEEYLLYDGSGSTIDVENKNDFCIDVNANYVIIRGFVLKGAQKNIINLKDGCHDIFIENCDMSEWGTVDDEGFGYNLQAGVYGVGESIERIVIQRCKIHDPRTDANSLAEEHNGSAHPAGPQAIVFTNSNGNNVIRYNEMWSDYDHMFNDIIGGWTNASYKGFPGPDSDIYGNYMSNCWDDGIESEGGNRNVRIWGNYIDSTFIAIGNAATSIGPLYIWKNTTGRSFTPMPNWLSINHGAWIKMGYSTDVKWMTGHMYLFNNTVLQPNHEGHGGLGVSGSDDKYSNRFIKHCVTRNNIFHAKGEDNSISLFEGCEDNSYDYDLYNNAVPNGSEKNGIFGTPTFATSSGFNNITMTAHYYLQFGTSGYDAGTIIPNFMVKFCGKAPDMGAFEEGEKPLEYGVNAYLNRNKK